jgi:hypothetical protein
VEADGSQSSAAASEPHAALFPALGYMRLRELLSCGRVCRRLRDAVEGPAPVAPPRRGAAAQPPDHGRGPPGADQQDRGAAPVPLPPRVPPSQDRGGRRPLPPALPTAGFDPLDPDISSPPRALSPVQVSLCKKALKLLGKKLKHPYALSKDFWSLPVCNSLPHSPSPSPYSDCSTKLSAAPNGSLRLSNID